MKKYMLAAIHRAHAVSLKKETRRFCTSLKKISIKQEEILQAIIRENANCQYLKYYLKEHDCTNSIIETVQEKLPIVSYKDLSPWIDKIHSTNDRVLTEEPVLFWEPTSGSTDSKKWIPYTASLLNSFNNGIKPWLKSLYDYYPTLKSGTHYWSISMATSEHIQNHTGIPLGVEDDSDFLDPFSRWAMHKITAVPSSIKHCKTSEEWQFNTCRYLLEQNNLSFISIWSPTFLMVLCDYIVENFDNMVASLSRNRQKEIIKSKFENTRDFSKLWPNLKLISCWTDGPSYTFAKALLSRFSNSVIQGKGLLATECVISIPFINSRKNFFSHKESLISQGSVLASNSHFFEFLEAETDCTDTYLAHELKIGITYIPVVTTSGGLYRYKINDLVRCTGFIQKTPTIEFVGKADYTSDVAGEKLHPIFIDNIIKKVREKMKIEIHFMLISAPKILPGSYKLFIDSPESDNDIKNFTEELEYQLNSSHHYFNCIKIGQLKPLSFHRVKNAWRKYQTMFTKHGMKLGDIKPSILNNRYDWDKVFLKN
ncbi:GH3 family domain-containing protein [Spartinivicinus poritis]|uniref:GH3 auxin-responsive promoter family protein n=1 Tax=Spartinivicinus poritis TaxID=2994640 RepID=A0ABT5UGU0_9GAMM|nr:GH3 auxin-responsive promoter family protein [Spartinivicinus sp. A2-2]MDE1465590.1 GH3 auxin-responsive promoter family protein [Spartinivicinus sp. A2-2]